MAGSGNTLQAITGLASNLANQEYGSYLDRLQGLSGQGLSAAGSMSGNNALAGNYQYGGAGTLAGILSNAGTSLAASIRTKRPEWATYNRGSGRPWAISTRRSAIASRTTRGRSRMR